VDSIRELGLRLPVIAKQVLADGGTRSYKMFLVLSLAHDIVVAVENNEK
jgi:hypothetical protein